MIAAITLIKESRSCCILGLKGNYVSPSAINWHCFATSWLILAEGAIALLVTLSGSALFASWKLLQFPSRLIVKVIRAIFKRASAQSNAACFSLVAYFYLWVAVRIRAPHILVFEEKVFDVWPTRHWAGKTILNASQNDLAWNRFEPRAHAKKACVTASARVWYLEPKWLRWRACICMWIYQKATRSLTI